MKIKGFWASEEYFFHSSEQLAVVGQVCPDIETMLFMFNNNEAVFSDLTCFNKLKVIRQCVGHWGETQVRLWTGT